MTRLVLAVVALTFVVASPTHSDAQSKKHKKKLTRKQKRKANAYTWRGSRFKALGDRYRWRKKKTLSNKYYKKAVIVYLAAYKIRERSSLIYKLANLYLVRGEMDWALRGYKRYLQLRKKGGASRRAKRMVARLTRVVKGQRDLGTLKDGDEDIDPTEVYGDEPEPPPKKQPDPPPEEQPDPPPKKQVVRKRLVKLEKPRPKQPGRMYKMVGLGTAGAGVLMMIIGIKFGLDASSASSDLSNNEDGWTEDDRQRIKDGQSASNKMIVFTLIGSAAIVGGGLLYYFGKKQAQRSRREVSVTPAVTPSSISIALTGRF